MSLGQRLKALRKENGWSQDELAYHAKIDGRQVSRYENDKVMPSIEVVIRMAKAYDVSIDFLLIDDAPRRPLTTPDDNGLIERLHDVQQLSEQDRQSLLHILDARVAKKRLKELAKEIG